MTLIDKIRTVLENFSIKIDKVSVIKNFDFDLLAEEISSLVYEREFVEWCITNVLKSRATSNSYLPFDHIKGFDTLDELHEYWLTIKTE